MGHVSSARLREKVATSAPRLDLGRSRWLTSATVSDRGHDRQGWGTTEARTRTGAVALLVISLGLLGCHKVTPESIETWKGTVKGPGKLEDAVTSSSVDPALRAQAAIALVEIGKGDRVAALLASMDPGDRGRLVTALVKQQTERLALPDKAAEARDSLVSLRPYANDAERAEIDQNLLAAIKRQLGETGRLGGSHSLGKIVEDIGAPAGPVLADLLAEPRVNHLEVAVLVDKVADPTLRDQASEKLVSVLPKLPAVTPEHYEALGRLGGRAAVDYLTQKVVGTRGDDAVRAAQALQLRPNPTLADLSVKLAANPATPPLVRDEMFGLAETCCGAATLEGLVAVIAETSAAKGQDDETAAMVRYRAYEAALAAAGAPAIHRALEAFPAKGKYKREDVTDFLVKDIQKVAARKDAGGGPEAVQAALVGTLGSASVLARMTAVLALGEVGTASQGAALGKMAGDRAKLDGFGPTTVGQEATRVAAKLAGK